MSFGGDPTSSSKCSAQLSDTIAVRKDGVAVTGIVNRKWELETSTVISWGARGSGGKPSSIITGE